MEELYNYKTLASELLGAIIAVVWICYALIAPGSMLFLVIALAATILLGTLLGGLIALNQEKSDTKEIIGWVLGASIAVVWISYALLDPGNMIFLVVAIVCTILLGTLSGGFIKLSKE